MYVFIKSSALLLFLHLLHIVEEPIDIIMLLDEFLGKFTEPVEYSQAEEYDYETEDVNYIHWIFISI